jgi:hypothetical protein
VQAEPVEQIARPAGREQRRPPEDGRAAPAAQHQRDPDADGEQAHRVSHRPRDRRGEPRPHAGAQCDEAALIEQGPVHVSPGQRFGQLVGADDEPEHDREQRCRTRAQGS